MKKYIVAVLVLVLAGLVGTFFGQMTNVPVYVSDPLYRGMVQLERDHPEFDILSIREYEDGALEVFLASGRTSNEAVEPFFDALFAWAEDTMMTGEYSAFRLVICGKVQGPYGSWWRVGQLWQQSGADVEAYGITGDHLYLDERFSMFASFFPLEIPVDPVYEARLS